MVEFPKYLYLPNNATFHETRATQQLMRGPGIAKTIKCRFKLLETLPSDERIDEIKAMHDLYGLAGHKALVKDMIFFCNGFNGRFNLFNPMNENDVITRAKRYNIAMAVYTLDALDIVNDKHDTIIKRRRETLKKKEEYLEKSDLVMDIAHDVVIVDKRKMLEIIKEDLKKHNANLNVDKFRGILWQLR